MKYIFLILFSQSVMAFDIWPVDIVDRYVYSSLRVSYKQVPYSEAGQPEWNESLEIQLFGKVRSDLIFNCEEVHGGEYLGDIHEAKKVSIKVFRDYAIYTYSARGYCKEKVHIFSTKRVNGTPRGATSKQSEKTDEYIIGYGNHGEDT